MSKIIKAVAGGIATIFGVDQKSPADPPPVQKPVVMPTPDDKAIEAARKKSIAAIMARQGRASTILTSDADSLGA